jgi:hypothetical protein
MAALLTAALLLSLAACGEAGTATPTPTPTPSEDVVTETPDEATLTPETDTAQEAQEETAALLQELLDAASPALDGEDSLPMSFIDPITDENFSRLGITEGDFASVKAACTAIAGIGTIAHEVALVYAPGAAGEIKSAIAEGYDSNKWVCVHPQKSAVVASGDYVLLAASRGATVDALMAAFAEIVGPGEVDVFFTFE